MRSKQLLFASLAVLLAMAPSAAGSMTGPQAYVDVWVDKGEGEVYREGEAVNIYVEASFDAFVMVYALDTDGYISVVFPYDCRDDGFLKGGKTYCVVAGAEDGFRAGGSRGAAYVRALASATPFRRLYWPGCPGYERYAGEVNWSTFADYWGPALPPQIHGEPHVAMQSIDEFICWDSINTGSVSVDYTYYYVMEPVEPPECDVNVTYTWPQSSYWPYWGPYWNVGWYECWDPGIYISFGLGNCYPCRSPWSWSWCSPTWCAPSWCWPYWYTPCYAGCYQGGCYYGGCNPCGYRCYDDCYDYGCGCTDYSCGTYPSQVKYKSNPHAGTGAGAAGGGASASAARSRSGDAEAGRVYTRGQAAASRTRTYATDGERVSGTRTREAAVDASREVSRPASREVSRPASRETSRETPREVSRPAVREVSREASGDAVRAPRESAEKKSTRATVRSTGEDRASSKRAEAVKSESGESRKPETAVKSTAAARSADSGRKAAPVKASPARSTAVKSHSSGSRSSSSPSGSSTSHRGSPVTRRSVSR